jgi:hypothetical protein
MLRDALLRNAPQHEAELPAARTFRIFRDRLQGSFASIYSFTAAVAHMARGQERQTILDALTQTRPEKRSGAQAASAADRYSGMLIRRMVDYGNTTREYAEGFLLSFAVDVMARGGQFTGGWSHPPDHMRRRAVKDTMRGYGQRRSKTKGNNLRPFL